MFDFRSGHDLTVCGSSPASGSVLTAQGPEPALDSVSPSLRAPPLLVLYLCLKNKNKHQKKNQDAIMHWSIKWLIPVRHL